MLKSEAQWLAGRLALWPSHRGVIVNVGSSDLHFRTRIQPWIEGIVFKTARDQGWRVIHQDLFPGMGIDVSGDLVSAKCLSQLRSFGIFGIILSNVLEHVQNREIFAKGISGLLPPEGRALITVPHRFPYHADPIDTGYRPNIAELLSLFPDFQMVESRIIEAGRLPGLILANPGRVISVISAPQRKC